MISLAGYEISKLIYQGYHSTVYRGKRISDALPVVIKIPSGKFLAGEALEKFRSDYEIGSSFDHPNIIRYYGLEKIPAGIAVITEDLSAVSLKEYIPEGGLGIKDFLDIAKQMTRALAAIHSQMIVFNDVKPGNVVIEPKNLIAKFIDFGISTTHETENHRDTSLHKLKGTYSYMSPEQTGRMNRSIDYRTDFYSLGVTFYEILCGHLPFIAYDTLEMVHCHLAKMPVPPAEVNFAVPKPVSDIIMKLLQKNAEDRYQNALGLLADLDRCSDAYQVSGVIPMFTLGENDVSQRFQIPQKLYGREEEVETLMRCFDGIRNGESGIFLVAGFSGVGKSALIHEIQKPITGTGGHFISGKFDQLARETAYSAIINAFQTLMRHILCENEKGLERWRQKLRSALGSNGRVIADIIPELALILGKQPPVQELGPVESQNRFNRVFLGFVKAFASHDHPLVLFLDDLQWADAASLDIIRLLATDTDFRHSLIIGAYRDNEVDSTHPAMMTINEITARGVPVTSLRLKPLTEEMTNRLVADVLSCDPAKSRALSGKMFEKTGGNPFFLKLFLRTMHIEGILAFETGKGWRWDLDKINKMSATDNVAEMMLRQFETLPPDTVETLRTAACLGNVFRPPVLALACASGEPEIQARLEPALRVGMLFRSDAMYCFAHDKVQEAAYSLIPDNEKPRTHLRIAKILADIAGQHGQDMDVFSIADHYNLAAPLITGGAELSELAAINLTAGLRAKKNAAFLPALRYFTSGLRCLDEAAWDDRYDLMYLLHRECAEAEYLCGNFSASRDFINVALRRARSVVEKADLYSMLIYQFTVKAEYQKAIQVGKEALDLVGISLPETDKKGALEREILLAEKNLGGRNISSLINSPELNNPTERAAMKLLMNLQPTAYMADPALYNLIAVIMTNISLTRGHTPESAKAYVTYANILSSIVKEYRVGYEYCMLALRMSEASNDLVQRCRGIFIYTAFLHHWTRHFSESDTIFNQGFQAGLEGGDLQYAGYILGFGAANYFNRGAPLPELEKKLEEYMAFVRKSQHQMPMDTIQSFQMVIANLTGKTDGPSVFEANAVDEDAFLAACRTRNVIAICYFLILKAQAFYLQGRYHDALECMQEVDRDLPHLTGTSSVAEHNFYSSLILAALHDTSSPELREEYMRRIADNQAVMKCWADNCPENFKHKYLLIEAERHRACGQPVEAMQCYDKAIKEADRMGFLQNAALANELAARFWIALGKEDFAVQYLVASYQKYNQWGAAAKCKDMVRLYPSLANVLEAERRSEEKGAKRGTSSSSTDPAASLDMMTLLKAARIISSEIMLDALLKKVMNTVIENAGAERGILVLADEGKLLVLVKCSVHDEATLVDSCEMEDSGLVSSAIVHFVARTKEAVLLKNASEDGTFDDDYMAKNSPRSVLAMPIAIQGKLIGVVYLENNMMAEAFTPAHIEILNIIIAQAAVAMENARLYANLVSASEKLRRSNEQLQDYSHTLEAKVLERTRELVTAKETAENATRLKNKFVALVSHDLKGPLGALQGLMKLVFDDDTPLEFARTCARRAYDSLGGLLEMTDKLLDIGRFQMGDIAPKKDSFDPSGLANEKIERLQPLADKKGLTLKNAIPRGNTLFADIALVGQVFLNLLGNAIKFTPEGGTITVAMPDAYSLSVEDTGKGIPDGLLPNLFRLDVKTTGLGTAGERGTGLGLPLCHDIMKAHGGNLRVETSKSGSRFIMEFPRTAPPSMAAENQEPGAPS